MAGRVHAGSSQGHAGEKSGEKNLGIHDEGLKVDKTDLTGNGNEAKEEMPKGNTDVGKSGQEPREVRGSSAEV